MQNLGELEIIITASLLLLVITTFIIAFVIAHEKRRKNFDKERAELKNLFEKEILKTELEIKEDTLQKISHEIHDNIGQVLSLAKLNLNTLAPTEDKKQSKKLEETRDIISKVIVELRDLSHSMNPDVIKGQGLASLLSQELHAIEKLGTYKTDLTTTGDENEVEPEKLLILYRMTQEVLNNALKHAQATEINIELSYLSEALKLSISDNGIGIKENDSSKGSGLKNLEYRSRLIGATLLIQGTTGQGTKVSFMLPVDIRRKV